MSPENRGDVWFWDVSPKYWHWHHWVIYAVIVVLMLLVLLFGCAIDSIVEILFF